jgi:GT2 family glycosyltransferase
MNTLQAVQNQSINPDWIVVVDNAADPELEAELAAEVPDVVYESSAENVGYGAALARGMRRLLAEYDPDWYWLLDDDTPPSRSDLSDALDVAEGELRPWVVANRGGRVVHGRLRHGFEGDNELNEAGFTLVDGTLIAREAVRRAGFPREDLFMMFEDIEYTTRIASFGGYLVVRRAETTAMHLGSSPSWRAYYLARNHLRTALHRRSPTWVWGWAYRMIALSTADVRGRRWDALRLRWKGAFDGASGRMGRRVPPGPT